VHGHEVLTARRKQQFVREGKVYTGQQSARKRAKIGDFSQFLVDFWPKTGENWAVSRGILRGNIACKMFI